MAKICSVSGCERPHKGRGYCENHLRRLKLYGDPLGTAPEKEKKVCNQCGKPHYCKGLCRSCYNRLARSGTLCGKAVESLPDEEWKESRTPGYMVSNLGRVKSVVKKDEKLLTTRKLWHDKDGTFSVVCRTNVGRMTVHVEVLWAFQGNQDGDTEVVFLDGDRANCRADNLKWYGREYLVEKAIVMAEESNHPLADCFLKFWNGDHNAINNWLFEISDNIRAYVAKCTAAEGLHGEFEEVVQQSMYNIFISLYRGMLKSFDTLESWVFGIVKNTFRRARKIRYLFSSIDRKWDGGQESSVLDFMGICHPSAELEVMYNEECLS